MLNVSDKKATVIEIGSDSVSSERPYTLLHGVLPQGITRVIIGEGIEKNQCMGFLWMYPAYICLYSR